MLNLISNRISGFVGVEHGKAEQPVWTRTANGATVEEACFARATQVWLDVKQHQCHIWRMNSMFEANCAGKLAWQLPIKFCVVHEAMNGCKNLKIH